MKDQQQRLFIHVVSIRSLQDYLKPKRLILDPLQHLSGVPCASCPLDEVANADVLSNIVLALR